jgi:hypothetical protein
LGPWGSVPILAQASPKPIDQVEDFGCNEDERIDEEIEDRVYQIGHMPNSLSHATEGSGRSISRIKPIMTATSGATTVQTVMRL